MTQFGFKYIDATFQLGDQTGEHIFIRVRIQVVTSFFRNTFLLCQNRLKAKYYIMFTSITSIVIKTLDLPTGREGEFLALSRAKKSLSYIRGGVDLHIGASCSSFSDYGSFATSVNGGVGLPSSKNLPPILSPR